MAFESSKFIQRKTSSVFLNISLLLQCFLIWFLNRVWQAAEISVTFFFFFLPRWCSLKHFHHFWMWGGDGEVARFWRVSCLMQMFNTHSIIYSCSHSRPGHVTAFINREAEAHKKARGFHCRCKKSASRSCCRHLHVCLMYCVWKCNLKGSNGSGDGSKLWQWLCTRWCPISSPRQNHTVVLFC